MLRAFEELSSCRLIVQGAVGPIPWNVIHQYAEREGLLDDEIAYGDFMFLIREMDEVFLKHKNEEIREARKKAEAQHGRPGSVRRTPITARPKRGR